MKQTRRVITDSIRQRIVAARASTGLSQEAFGKQLKPWKSKDSVVDWENNGKTIDVRELAAIATLTGADFSDVEGVAELLSIERPERNRVAEPSSVPYGSPDALAGELTAIAEALLGVVRRMRGGGASYADLLGPKYERLEPGRPRTDQPVDADRSGKESREG